MNRLVALLDGPSFPEKFRAARLSCDREIAAQVINSVTTCAFSTPVSF